MGHTKAVNGPGDVIRLKLETLFPADARLLEATVESISLPAVMLQSRAAGERSSPARLCPVEIDATVMRRTPLILARHGTVQQPTRSHFQKAVLKMAIPDFSRLFLVAGMTHSPLFAYPSRHAGFCSLLLLRRFQSAMPTLSVTMAVGRAAGEE